MTLRIGSRRALLGGKKLRVWKPDPLLGTFTAGMAKRATSVFAAAPIVQSKWDGTGTPDVVSFSRGTLLGNQTQLFYSNFDPYQFTASKWWTAETNSADRSSGYSYVWYVSSAFYCRYDYANSRFDFHGGNVTVTRAQAITAGTTYHIVYSADTKNTIDGTNFTRNTINDSHAYGGTSLTATAPDATIYLGSDGSASPASAIVEGLRIDRFVWFDGTYGIDIGVGDMIANAYAAGAGADPALWLGSWDETFCLPTNATAGALVTGAGEAHSHPHGSSIADDTFLDRGGYLGGPYSVVYNGTSTWTNCGTDVSLDDLPSGATLTIGVWVLTNGNSGRIIGKKSAWNDGWEVLLTGGYSYFSIYLADTPITAAGGALSQDGKWHYIHAFYDDATKTARVGIDGVWDSANVGAGAYQSDAAGNLILGRIAYVSTWYWNGAIGWAELSNNDRHGGAAGTNFVRPRAPYADGNTIEYWLADEGTGATLGAGVAGANDGTITDGSWASEWDQAGTPVVPQSVEFFTENDGIDFGSGVNIDNLFSADATIEFLARLSSPISANHYILTKGPDANSGWYIQARTGSPAIRIRLHFATDVVLDSTSTLGDSIWHHIAIDWDVGTLTARLFVDGLVQSTGTAVGAYTGDAGADCLVNALGTIGILDGSFAIGPIRLSNNRRYTGTFFVPPSRTNWPANDANAHLITRMNDGAGATVTDYSGNGYNGTITFGATTRWNNTPDMAVDEPGARMYNNGYNIGSDGVDDGLVITETVTAETDYVIYARVSCGQSGRGFPQIYVYDNIGAAQIGADYNLPRMTGTHTGGAAAKLVCATGYFTQQLVGWTIYNITQGTSGTAATVSGYKTTFTGGPDFNNGDTYLIRPPNTRPYCRHPNAVESIFVFRTPAGCTEIKIELRNAAGEDVLQWQQCEVQPLLSANGDHESAAGDPAILTGWDSNGLDAGDVETDAATIHAGAQSLEWNPGAVLGEGQYETVTTTIGKFVNWFGWTYGDGTTGFRISVVDAARALLQYSTSAYQVTTPTTAAWRYSPSVWRALHANPRFQIEANTIAGDGFSDDFGGFELDDVSLTITPASEANSAEGMGIRVDGLDTLTRTAPSGYLKANEGDIRFKVTPRHGDTESVLFGNTGPRIATIWGDANNYVFVRFNAADTLQMRFNANGAGAQTNTWATGGSFFTPGTEYTFRIRYWSNRAVLYIDGVARITITQSTGFVWPDPTTLWWGTANGSTNQVDAVFAKA